MHRATSEEEALNLLFLGDTNRAISETAMNQASSRSHCLFTVFLECRGAGGSDKVRRSKLHLVDLAGSERVHKTKSDGITLNEAKYINTSLFYLEMVIVALNERNENARDHIPYRNSMMTSVLRDSLGGNCRTVMVATCSAEKAQTEESISTCRFAQRVALVKNDAVLNEETDPSVTIARLKAEVASLRARLEGQGRGDELADGRDPDHRLAAALGRIRLQEAALADVRATTSRFFGFEIEEEEMRARISSSSISNPKNRDVVARTSARAASCNRIRPSAAARRWSGSRPSASSSPLPCPSSRALREATSALSRAIVTDGSVSSLRTASFLTSATRCAKRHVLIDSSVWAFSAEQVATMTVRQLPPRESRSTDVIIEFL